MIKSTYSCFDAGFSSSRIFNLQQHHCSFMNLILLQNAFMAWSLLLQITLSYLLACLHACMHAHERKKTRTRIMHGFVPFFISLVPNFERNKTHDSIPSFFRWIYEKTSIELNPKLASWHGKARQLYSNFYALLN
jgi:hypothetical protein